MGGNESVPLPPPPNQNVGDGSESFYFTFSIWWDTLSLVYAPQSVIALLLEKIENVDLVSVKKHQPKSTHGYKIVFTESLFSYGGTAKRAIACRKLIAVLLQTLSAAGWVPLVSTDLRRVRDTACVIFHWAPDEKIAPDSQLLTLSLSSFDQLKVFPDDDRVVEAIKDSLTTNDLSIQHVRHQTSGGVSYIEIKISGTPWFPSRENQSVATRMTIADIIANLQKINWRLIINFNCKTNIDTFFFAPSASFSEAKESFPVLKPIITLALSHNDQLRLMSRNKDGDFDIIVNQLREACNQNWHRGLRDEWSKSTYHNFRLNGTPWWLSGEETVESRVFACKILEIMIGLGWRIICPSDITRKKADKTTFHWEKVSQHDTLARVNISCLSFNETDKVRAINMTADCVNVIDETLKNIWTITRFQTYGKSTEWKLSGDIWGVQGKTNSYEGKAIAVHLLSAMVEKAGQKLLTSADVSAKVTKHGSLDVHSWFFIPVDVLLGPL